ncbi:hypothetical protein DPMN_137909 [Dreissena polymorpha]|uniref:Uncharacterized protein n=1 Tax=Dreissena polymorpha TaxID=45954 RepID=A0A9D4G3B8_DREPO|nr:hypothetical protein DPMN_137909 [Dreissena polymorpha]
MYVYVIVFSTNYVTNESMCRYVQYKNTLVLTYRDAHTVYVYDTLNGTSRAVNNKNMREPCVVCVGPDDTVLVCSKIKPKTSRT